MSDSTPGFREMKSVVIRFAGDSGDGMQIVGERFTDTSVTVPNSIATFPDYPAEIRAPVGTIGGVSAFQVHFGSSKVLTSGDAPDALVAMNPAALAVHLPDLVLGGLLVVNTAAFTEDNLKMAGFTSNPLDDPSLGEKYILIALNITALALEALKESPLTNREKLRCKNFLALGFMFWVYSRPIEPTLDYIQGKWEAKLPDLAAANAAVVKAGYFLGETSELTIERYRVARAVVEPGIYRKISGNEATALGLIAASRRSGRDLLFSGYPITPATSVLETLAGYKHFGVTTVQAEDEIAAIGIALGGSYTGKLGATATSGPGMCLKSEFIGLAITTELPLVIVNIQRGGPSTGLPTKTEQSDLLQAMYGRHGESPLPIVAANSPSDCFAAAFEAARIAIQYSTPVILLTDGYLANGSEPWLVPNESTLPDISKPFADESKPYVAFARDPHTLARTHAIPGQPGLEHRIGGLEKNEKGAISYDAETHSLMTTLRAAKVAGIAKDLPPMNVIGERNGKILVLGWGGTHGAITSAVATLRSEGHAVSGSTLRHLNPLPADLADLLAGFEQVLIPELNNGQLNVLIRANYLVDTLSMPKVQGQPFKISEIRARILELLNA
ncbi:MAG: 2-oxoacid:acceptor oxidoreductase subunit alpha [Verrucomicrobia bacterium]|nr:MAG: 2-oxoacid:acceptor oxidoreductase subunit alpha [Verrucomicrobiota bacterium]